MALSLTIGTRGSPLALYQADLVKSEVLKHNPDADSDIQIIKTSGDWSPEDGEVRLPTKALFAKEIEQALLERRIDIAVHSMKDMDSELPQGLVINHMLPREDMRDCLIVANGLSVSAIDDLPENCVIGTSSVRRAAMVRAKRPDVRIEVFRGNVETRLKKLEAGDVDATFLALAGLKRLGLDRHADVIVPIEQMLPAAGQGAIGIEMREGEDEIDECLNQISCEKTVLCVKAERAVLKEIEGSCDTPIGVHASLRNGTMDLHAHLLRSDGLNSWFEHDHMLVETVKQAEVLGQSIGEKLKPYV